MITYTTAAHTTVLEDKLFDLAVDFEKTFDPSIFSKAASYFTKKEHPDLLRARNIIRLITELRKDKAPLQERSKVVVLVISAVFNSNSKIKKIMVRHTVSTIGSMTKPVQHHFKFDIENMFDKSVKPKKYEEMLESIVKELFTTLNTSATNKLLTAPPSEDIFKGPFTFVAISRLHKNSPPGNLPKDILKLVYVQAKTDTIEALLSRLTI